MQIKLWLVIFLLSTLVACASTPVEVRQEKKDDEAAEINVQLAAGYMRRGDLEVAQEKLLKAIKFNNEYVPAYTTLAVLLTQC